MQGIYTYISEMNHVSREHRVAAILVLLFMVLISLIPALTSFYLYVSLLLLLLLLLLFIIVSRTMLFQQHIVQLVGETNVEYC